MLMLYAALSIKNHSPGFRHVAATMYAVERAARPWNVAIISPVLSAVMVD
jgi:hypothetical protein